MRELLRSLNRCLMALLALVLVGGVLLNPAQGQRTHPALVTLMSEEEVQAPRDTAQCLTVVARKRAADPLPPLPALSLRLSATTPLPQGPALVWRVPEARAPPTSRQAA